MVVLRSSLLAVCVILGSALLCAALTVEQVAVQGGCSTSPVNGLSKQLIDQTQCLSPGTLKSISGHSNIKFGSAAFPWLQTAAANALVSVVNNAGKTLTINSGLRTLPQQYLLYRWNNLGMCGITAAAAPGRSNHNGGTAVDVSSYDSWINSMKAGNWKWYGNGDKPHFDYVGGSTKDIRSLSTKAFQILWNRNNPNDKIAEDGQYGPATEARLQKSPAGGFAKGATCGSAKDVLELDFEVKESVEQKKTQVGDECIAPSGQVGTCQIADTCTATGTSRPIGGYCPGPNNLQCCMTFAAAGPTQGKTTNAAGIDLIKQYEGFYPNFYIDPVGIKTIGYGHACHVNDCDNLQAKNSVGQWREVFAPLSKTDASDLLRGDLQKGGYERCVDDAIARSLTSDQFSSLVSFVFNVGCGGFQGSTLRSRVEANKPLEGSGGIREAFLMWNKGGGKVLPGLTNRRNAEADLYGSGGARYTPPGSSGDEGGDCWYRSQKGV